MFSYLLSGRLGEFMAPRPSSAQEIWSLLKAGMFDKVLVEIKKPTFNIDVNGLDISSGMTILHYACAGGSVELVAELLSRGTDLTVPSADGNNALHFAALNNRKGIIEILLRSGADPSVPNHAGMLPIELTKAKDVKELFLRDRSGIFSPIAIAQSRAMISEFVKAQTPATPSAVTAGTAISGEVATGPDSAVSSIDTEGSAKTSHSLPIFNMANEFEKEAVTSESPANSSNSSYLTSSPPVKTRSGLGIPAPVVPRSPMSGSEEPPIDILSPLNSRSKHPPSRLHQEHSDSASMSDDGDYTIVGVASVKKPINGYRPSLFREVSTSSTGSGAAYTAESALDGIESPLVATPTATPEKSSRSGGGGGGGVSMVPMLNLSQLAPPPIDPLPDVVSYSVSGIPSARGARPPLMGLSAAAAGSAGAGVGSTPSATPGITSNSSNLTPLVLSARRGSGGGSDREPTPGSPTNKTSSSINFYQPDTGIPVNTLILSPSHPAHSSWGEDAAAEEETEHSLFIDYNSNHNRSAAHRRHQQALTNSQLKSSSGSGRLNSAGGGGGTTLFGEDTDPDAEELQKAVVQAATETALSFQSNRDEYEARRVVVRNCQKLNEKTLRKLLTYDPSLAVSRATELGALAPDGQTPLHVAAAFGNIEALRILLEMGASAGASCWVRDIQGRTPLHVAAEKGKTECCEYLREQMKKERRDPVGVDAPTDLAGTTPLGWASLSSKGKPKSGVETLLFKAGDRSILPLTPHSIRAGKSPWKSPLALSSSSHSAHLHPHQSHHMHPPHHSHQQYSQERENLVFAFSEANGWTPIMEDRIMICCPVVNHASWSLFGVFDGHGGAFCSSFLAAGVPAILSREATIIGAQFGCHDHDVTPEILRLLLTNICTAADEELSKHPRMAVEKSETGKITCLDSSGSTGVMALLTSKLLAVSNVGDSRAVLAVRQATVPASPDTKPLGGGSGVIGTPVEKSHPSPIVCTPENAENRGPLDNLAASIERLNPNLSTPTTATPNAYGTRQSPSSTSGIAAHTSYLPGFLQAVELSTDHKPYLHEERARAEAAGAVVEQVPNSTAYQMTVKGVDVKLRMSRSFGDFYMKQNTHLPPEKQAVIAVPEVMTHTRGESDAFLVLACDGIFDVMTNQEVVDYFGEKLGFTGAHSPIVSTQLAAEACDALLSECLTRGTVDNISVILIVLGAAAPVTSSSSTAPHSANPYQYYSAASVGTGSSAVGASSAQRRNSHTLASTASSAAGMGNGTTHFSEVRASHSSDALHHHVQRSPRDYSVDMPISGSLELQPHHHHHSHHKASTSATPLHVFQPTSLNNVFSNVASSSGVPSVKPIHTVGSHGSLDSDSSDTLGSPLNMIHHNGKVRKQLQFNDDS